MIGNFENSHGHLEAHTAIVSNDRIRSILGLITMPIVINVEPVFLVCQSPSTYKLYLKKATLHSPYTATTTIIIRSKRTFCCLC